jgi:hypothetical protein
MPKISDAALAVLEAAFCDGNKITLNSGELERELYLEVDAVLSRLGGKWKGGKTRAHLFDYDVSLDFADILETQEMPPDNPLDYYPTSESLAKEMVTSLRQTNPLWICDPSAGEGVLLRELKLRYPNANYHAIELDPRRARRLKAQGWTTFNSDFLALKPGDDLWFYNVMLMNPPFNVDGNALTYIDHINHAWACLPPGGELRSIACRNYKDRTEDKAKAFRKLLLRYGDAVDLDEDAFEHCKIKTPTSLIRLVKTGR